MLEEYKEAYRQKADYIAGWNKLSRSELCRKYIENIDNKDISESYLSAIIYKFWNVAEHNYFTQSYKGLATQQDCYDWNVEGILYALDKHVWDDPNNELYGDPNGPEKAINVTIYGQKLNFYNSLKTYKRQINSGLVSQSSVLNCKDYYDYQLASKDNSILLLLHFAVYSPACDLFWKEE